MDDSPTQRVVAKLQEFGCAPRGSGTGWVARCPAHEDRNASLTINEGTDGRALVHCHAGCGARAIALALNMTVKDWFPPRGDGRARAMSSPKKPAAEEAPSLDWPKIMRTMREARTTSHLEQLAEALGPAVTVAGLESMDLGWCTQEIAKELTGTTLRASGWAFAMHNARGSVIGINVRAPGGAKITLRSGKLGIFMPKWEAINALQGPVYVVEGASDIAAAMSAGIPAVGRPSAMYGGQLLAACEWLKVRQVIVLGEQDRSGAGERGSKKVAAELAEAWRENITCMMPPEGYKDLREYLNSQVGKGMSHAG